MDITYSYTDNDTNLEGKGTIVGYYGIDHKSRNAYDGTLPKAYFIILTEDHTFITLPIECCKPNIPLPTIGYCVPINE